MSSTGTPFFSIVIPSKNRPEQVRDAVRSALAQTNSDLEVVVCDNSDGDGDSATSAAVRGFGDPRVRLVRTDGTLSMPDNWERAVTEARGEYVGVLTDRSVFRRSALATIRDEIDRTGAQAVSWFADLYGRDPEGEIYRRRACTFRRYELPSRDVLRYFVDGHPKYATKVVPKLMTAMFHRSVLERARSSAVGRCCPPVAPDFTSGFLMLAFADRVVFVDEPLYVSCGQGTGAAFRHRAELGVRFRDELGMTWDDLVDRMPSRACFSHALVLNDLMRLRDALPDELGDFGLNPAQYYLGCLGDYVKAARQGFDRSEDLRLLVEALEQEPKAVKRAVTGSRSYEKAVDARPGEVSVPAPAPDTEPAKVLRFPTVFDALEWDESHPREPAEQSFLDLLPPLEAATRPAVSRPERPDRRLRTRLRLAVMRRRLLSSGG